MDLCLILRAAVGVSAEGEHHFIHGYIEKDNDLEKLKSLSCFSTKSRSMPAVKLEIVKDCQSTNLTHTIGF